MSLMSRKMIVGKDLNGIPDYSLFFSAKGYQILLANTGPQSLTIPTESQLYKLIFTYTPGASVWVALNTTAINPTVTGVFVETESQFLPTVRIVPGGSYISIVTANTSPIEVGIAMYEYKSM